MSAGKEGNENQRRLVMRGHFSAVVSLPSFLPTSVGLLALARFSGIIFSSRQKENVSPSFPLFFFSKSLNFAEEVAAAAPLFFARTLARE